VVPTDTLLVTDFGPSFCTYSPNYLDDVISETELPALPILGKTEGFKVEKGGRAYS
jgi:hypothetical protein